MKLINTITQVYKKGEVYNMADNDCNLPKHNYTDYFENDDSDELEGEWKAMDKCKKSFKVVTKIYE